MGGTPVNIVRALYARFRQLIHEFAKFGVIGVIGVVITNGGYAILHDSFGTGPVTATTVATIVATALSYLGNRYWTFVHRERTGVGRETVIFFVLNGFGLAIQDAVVAFNAYALGLQHNRTAEFAALNAGIVLATFFRFWSYRKWVWLAPSAGESGQPAVQAGGPGSGPDVAAVGGGRVPAQVMHANGHAAGTNGNGMSRPRTHSGA